MKIHKLTIAGCCLCVAMLCYFLPASGSPIDDDEASLLMGGCSGVNYNGCSGMLLACPITSVFRNANPGEPNSIAGNEPSSIPAYFCAIANADGYECLSCAATYKVCARVTEVVPN